MCIRDRLEGELKDGYYLEPTILFGQNNMRVFQEEIFGPVLAVTTFKTMEEALEIANDTPYGLGAGVWSRKMCIRDSLQGRNATRIPALFSSLDPY